ncbi:GH23478 [Drosophila grimshawi]|uniref:GH23478 n=1 Tax=Drosophila grimshawi TaxID=7222 RepID=B4K2G9_DROGR|nr:GH23478 [Drosophila grimshawi]
MSRNRRIFRYSHGYHDIVKEPMDLRTIQNRLNSHFYTNTIDFARDVRLIFGNTYLYTTPDHVCYQMAYELELIFEKMFAAVPLTENFVKDYPWTESSNSSYSPGMYASSINNSSIRQSSNDESDSDANSQLEELPLTEEEDFDLYIRVQQLEGAMLLNVIHMIHQLEDTNYVNANSELELYIHLLKTHTKRTLLAYLSDNGITDKRVTRMKKNISFQ